VEISFCSDLKFTMLVLGLDNCASEHGCPFCLSTKSERHNLVRKPIDPLRFAKTTRPSLFPFLKPTDVRPDPLHLLLRITDVLLKQLFDELVTLGRGSPAIFAAISAEMNRIKIHHFEFWKSKKTDKEYCWTSLNGRQRRIVIAKFVMANVFGLHQDRAKWTADCWSGFAAIMSVVDSWAEHTTADAERFRAQVHAWATKTFAPGKLVAGKFVAAGYSRDAITPYIHILHSHVPDLLPRCLPAVSCQNQERQNAIDKRAFFATHSMSTTHGRAELGATLRARMRRLFDPFVASIKPDLPYRCPKCPNAYTSPIRLKLHQAQKAHSHEVI
jgi:hypothetical protein